MLLHLFTIESERQFLGSIVRNPARCCSILRALLLTRKSLSPGSWVRARRFQRLPKALRAAPCILFTAAARFSFRLNPGTTSRRSCAGKCCTQPSLRIVPALMACASIRQVLPRVISRITRRTYCVLGLRGRTVPRQGIVQIASYHALGTCLSTNHLCRGVHHLS